MSTQDLIREKLAQLASDQNIRLLHACESGSRAWGFASPDSDYDVRLIYSCPLAWYLSLEETRDTVESLDEATAIDLSGWELRKALRQFAGCNPSLNEWLLSPIVYSQETDFIGHLRGLMPRFFNPQKAMYHYLGTARQMMRNHLDGDRIGIKKAFYIIRPLAAAAWVRDLRSQPPTEFSTLLLESPSPEFQKLRQDVADLIERKATALEKEPITLPAPFVALLAETFPALEESARNMPATPPPDRAPLQELFCQYVKS